MSENMEQSKENPQNFEELPQENSKALPIFLFFLFFFFACIFSNPKFINNLNPNWEGFSLILGRYFLFFSGIIGVFYLGIFYLIKLYFMLVNGFFFLLGFFGLISSLLWIQDPIIIIQEPVEQSIPAFQIRMFFGFICLFSFFFHLIFFTKYFKNEDNTWRF